MITLNYDEVMKRFFSKYSTTNMRGSDGKINTKSMDDIISYTSNGKFKTYQSLLDSFVNDLNTAHTNRWSVEKFCETYCGMNFKNNDVGAIGGLDIGGSTIKNASAIVSDVAMNQWKLPTSNKVTIDGCTFVFDKTTGLSSKEQYLLKGLSSSWLKGALQTLKDGYGLSFTSSLANCKTITVKFVSENSKRAAWVSAAINRTSGKATRLELYINTYLDFDTSSVDGKVLGNFVGENLLDRTLAHELTHACMYSVGTFGNDMPVALSEGLSELLVGIDDTRKSYVTTALSKSNVATFTKGMALNATSVADQIKYGGSVALLRYLIQQSVELDYAYTDDTHKTVELLPTYAKSSYVMSSYSGVANLIVSNNSSVKEIIGTSVANKFDLTSVSAKVNAGASNDTINLTTSHNSVVNGETGNDVIVVKNSNYVTTHGNDGNDTITLNSSNNNYVYGDNGNDIITVTGNTNRIYGGSGTDRFTLGTGLSNELYGNDANDTFVLNGSKNAIIHGNKGLDSITVNSGTGNRIYADEEADTITIIDGSQNTFYAGSGADKIYVKGGTSNKIYADADNDMITVTNGTSNTITAGAGVDTVTISGGKSTTVYGGVGADKLTITNGSSHTLNGDADADIIYIKGGTSNRAFGGEGNDKMYITSGTSNSISGGNGNDILEISGSSKGQILGGAGVDTITVKGGSSHIIHGDAGNDIITITGGSSNKIYGDAGNDTFAIKGGTKDIFYAGNGNNTFTIDASLFKGQSTISLKGFTSSAVNTFKFTGALAKYKFLKSGNNLVVAYGSSKITIEDWSTHKSSIMYFADGTKRNFSYINSKIK